MLLRLFQSKCLFWLFVEITRVVLVSTHQCYVCGPKTNASCDKFDPSNETFIKDCPSAIGCSIIYGKPIERSCEQLNIRDCQIANDVQYCYCARDLCNGNTINFIDDEDLMEEGSGTTITMATNSIENRKILETNNSKSMHKYSLFLLIPTILKLIFY